MAINYRKIAECIADEMLPIQKKLAALSDDKLLALEILNNNGLLDQYFKSWRKQLLIKWILIDDDTKI